MRPARGTDAHATGRLAELVCPNSFRTNDAGNNAMGLLHEEMQPTIGGPSWNRKDSHEASPPQSRAGEAYRVPDGPDGPGALGAPADGEVPVAAAPSPATAMAIPAAMAATEAAAAAPVVKAPAAAAAATAAVGATAPADPGAAAGAAA